MFILLVYLSCTTTTNSPSGTLPFLRLLAPPVRVAFARSTGAALDSSGLRGADRDGLHVHGVLVGAEQRFPDDGHDLPVSFAPGTKPGTAVLFF